MKTISLKLTLSAAVIAIAALASGCMKPAFVLRGATGPAGKPATTLLPPTINTSPATALDCPTGGITVTVSTPTVAGSMDSVTKQVTSVCNGGVGSTGLQGLQGLQGLTGATGPSGAPGADAASVTPIQFCPGYTLSYPSTFPEYGIFIGGVLFAIYDGGANDVFLSKIPAGYYASTSTSAPCNFTVNSDGTITN